MFHIFYVNQGYMLMLEPPTLGSIYDLQKSIEKSTGIGIDNQLLFSSDGCSLVSSTMLASITGVGTDTNPIFLVRRVSNTSAEIGKGNFDGINELFRGWSSEMDRLNRISTTSSSAITECIELAKKCNNVAETIIRFCSNLISEHHYLHQGWKAVIANLDDSISRTQKYLQRSKRQAEKLEIIRTKGRILLGDFDNVIEILTRITIPSSLLSPPAQILTPSSTGSNNSSNNLNSCDEEITLYDWLSSKDPAYSLNSLSQLMLDHLEKTDETDLLEATSFFTIVQGVSTKAQYREIGGIDKRLATLRSKLEHLEGILVQVREISNRIIQPIIQDNVQNIAIWQKQRLNELKQPLKHIYDFAISFIDSKDEVVKNISQRFGTWVRQAYDRLDKANKKLVVFEEKYSGLRQRLDLVRQIKEAPNVYMMAIPEVIRREELRKEFSCWITTHIEKCSSFITQENRIREQFQNKLDKHFLCQLFPGMNDRIPQFTTLTAPKIDQNLPKISSTHLSELRKIFPHMKEFLIVGAPMVFQRLSVFDFTTQSSILNNQQIMLSQIRRDQSFYDRDRMSNIDAMKINFTSTNWLSEENMDIISPSIPIGHTFLTTLTRDGTNFASNTSLNSIGTNILTDSSPPRGLYSYSGQQPHFALTSNNNSSNNLVSNENRESMSPLQPSAPIAIPITTNLSDSRDNDQHQQQNKEEESSLNSNNFSTPEEYNNNNNFGNNEHNRFISNVNSAKTTFQNYPLFRCSPKITRPSSLIRAQCANQPALVEEVSKDEVKIKKDVAKIGVEDTTKIKLKNVKKQVDDLSEHLNSLRNFGKELKNNFNIFLPSSSKENIFKSIEEIVNQRTLAALEEYKIQIEKENLKRFKEIEVKMNKHIDQLEEKLNTEQIIRKEKEIQLEEKEKQIVELIDKIELLTKENDILNSTLKNEENKDEKEDETKIIDSSSSSQNLLNKNNMIDSCVQSESQDQPPTSSSLSVTASFIDLKDDSTTSQTKIGDNNNLIKNDETCTTNKGIGSMLPFYIKHHRRRSIKTQTFIRNNDMKILVSLGEIIEGLGALIIWNDKMNAFVAYCSSQKPYIVKDTSLKQVGLVKISELTEEQISQTEKDDATDNSNNTNNRKWAFVIVENILLCEIKKTTNRYNLPINTRFYNITVLPMPGDFTMLNSCDLTTIK